MNDNSQNIFLPGGIHQLNHLKANINTSDKDILIIGSNPEGIAISFLKDHCNTLDIIVEDHNSLLNSRLKLKDFPSIKIRMMEYQRTDFQNNRFDIVYTQASVSSPERNSIIKELKRILKSEGILSAGEITSLKEPVPQFVKDIWDNGYISPLKDANVSDYYLSRGFELIDERDLSERFTGFLFNNRKNYYKKKIPIIQPVRNHIIKNC
jgi:ubiquinone/menaquinone biosynthesis C-methylase UbiE